MDKDLLIRAAGGDREAFTRLVHEATPLLRRFVLWRTEGSGEGEDILQEVLLQVQRSLPSFRGESRFETWLYALARNVCRSALRRRGRPAAAVSMDADDAGWLEIPDGSPGLLETLEGEQTRLLLREAVERLPVAQREVVLLRDWEGLSYEEMARVLDVPIGTVRSRLHNATVRLAEDLMAALGPASGRHS